MHVLSTYVCYVCTYACMYVCKHACVCIYIFISYSEFFCEVLINGIIQDAVGPLILIVQTFVSCN